MHVLLFLHIAAAVLLWGWSAYAIVVATKSTDVPQLIQTRKLLSIGILITSVLGIGTALSFASLTIAVCAQLGLYLSPSLIASFLLTKATRKSYSSGSDRSL